MPGVRVTHIEARNCRFTVAEAKPYRTPYQCTPPEFGGCGRVHTFKTHHLNLDESGSCIINDVLFKLLRPTLVANGFSEGNVVKKPPTQGIGAGAQVTGAGSWGNIPIISIGHGIEK